MREFFRIEEIDHESGVIRAVPSVETPVSRPTIIGPINTAPWRVRSVAEVRALLGMNANQAYKAKSRVLMRIRKILSELDPDSTA